MSLKFKGDKTSVGKKRKRVAGESSDAVAKRNKDKAVPEFDESDMDGWMDLAEPEACTGPIYLTIRSPIDPDAHLALSANAVTHRVSCQPIGEAALDDPQDLIHVWVCTRVQDSADKVTLRASTGRYLAADSSGIISADREARGELEEWTMERVKGGYALRTRFGTYVGVDEVAGGKVELRGDVESASSASETWRVRMQKTYRHEMAKRRLAEKRQLGNGGATIAPDGITIVRDFGAAESSSIRKFQAYGFTGQPTTSTDARTLRKAQAEGRLGEEMLDRRAKMKSDKFC